MVNGKLRVMARGVAQVPNYESLDAGRNARVTHACLAIGPEFKDPETGQMQRHAAFVKHVGKVIEIPDRAEYRRHLRDGDLWPADEETACACGVEFDPNFGGEHTEAMQDEHEAAVEDLKKNPMVVAPSNPVVAQRGRENV